MNKRATIFDYMDYNAVKVLFGRASNANEPPSMGPAIGIIKEGKILVDDLRVFDPV